MIFSKIMYPGLWKLAKDEVCNHFENSCTRVYGNWSKMKFVIFSKIRVPGSMKIGKTWSLIFFWKFIYRVYKKWLKLKSMIFLKIHVPGSKKIGSKWILIFFWKFMYPGLQKLAKNEVCDFSKDLCTRVYENWPKMKFVIILKIHVPWSMEIGQIWSLWIFQKIMYLGLWKLAKNEFWYF